jgi:hypothetical protein
MLRLTFLCLFASLNLCACGGSDSPTSDVPTALSENSPPVAVISSISTGVINNTVVLNGSNSYDSDNENLSYEWALTGPSNSQSALNNNALSKPSFIPDLSGEYQACLTVKDQMLSSNTKCISITVNPGWPTTALEALSRASTRRVDLVMLGDSNQYKDGYGFDYGIRIKLHERYGLYATNIKIGNNFGTDTGGSEAQEQYQLAPIGYRYVGENDNVANSTYNGVQVGTGHNPVDPSANLRLHYSYSSFATGNGSFKVGVRREESPWTVISMGSVIYTNTGSEDYVMDNFDLPAGDRDGLPLSFKWTVPTQQSITGPFLSYSMRVENLDKSDGISCHTIYGSGGQSLWDMANTMSNLEIEYLSNYFAEVRRLQISEGLKPIVVIYVNSGLNDQNETSVPSLGWRASYDADSAEAYLDNLEVLTQRFSDVWTYNNWDSDELFFWIVPSHPTSSPDSEELSSYRAVASSFADSHERTSFVNFENITSYTEMYENGWYLNDGADVYHLTKEGYVALSQKLVDLIP